MRVSILSACLALSSTFSPALAAPAPQELGERVDRLEAENAELRRKVDLLAADREDFELDSLVAPLGEGVYGLSPAASKVYGIDGGVAIGGYGEARYQNFSSGGTDTADLLRAVLYFGYRFNENWVFNSEIEFEHASTGESGESSVEFAYLENAACEAVGVRAGLLLLPMGFVNELHEPTTYLAVTRPEVERRIIPTTWRELGVGVFGDVGPLTYRTYVVNGFDATGFSAGGLRGGRQKGSQAKAEDVAVVSRLEWNDTPGVNVGGSFYAGNSGQDQTGLGRTTTTIVEAHAEYRAHGVWARGLYAMAEVDDVAQLNAVRFAADPTLTPADSVGEELDGGYVEIGYDVLAPAATKASLSPYLRYEMIDTQAEVPSGFGTRSANDIDVKTIGIAYQPFDSIVFKIDYQDYESGPDRVNVSAGYSF